jgi:predicted amidohydrolase YtcJ
MKQISKLLMGVAVTLALAFCNNSSQKTSAAADAATSIYFGGDIITMEGDSATYAEAVAVKDGKIVFVGSKADAEKMKGESTIMNDLKGKTMMPGFIDPHLHPILGAIVLNTQFATPFDWNFPWGKMTAVRGHEAFMAKVKEYDAAMKNPTEQLIVWGYMEPFHGSMSRKELDAISTTRPIMVWQYSAHEMFLNTAALKSFGVTEEETRGNSQIFYDKGRFLEAGFFNVIVPKLAPSIMGDSIMKVNMEKFRAVTHLGGVTTIGDMATGTTGSIATDMKFIADGLENDATPFRIQLTPDCNTLSLVMGGDENKIVAAVNALQQKGSPHMVISHNVKLFSDGAFFGQAFLVEPPGYKDGHKGEWIMTPDRLEKAMRLWWNTDYTIHIHCNGSGGLTAILDVLEKLQKEKPKKDHRLTIEHFGQSSAAQAKRIAGLGAIVSANPYYLYSMGDKYAAGNLGEQRASEMVRLGSLLKNKVPFALHSDFTMAPIQPLLLAWIAVNRITADGTLMAPQERVPIYNALQAITSNAAFILRMDNVTGSITTGKKADFVILAENPLKIDPMKIKDIKIYGTVFEGKSFLIQ